MTLTLIGPTDRRPVFAFYDVSYNYSILIYFMNLKNAFQEMGQNGLQNIEHMALGITVIM